MEHFDNEMNNKRKELMNQLNRIQAYGIDSSGLIPDIKESLWNDDIIDDKENLRE